MHRILSRRTLLSATALFLLVCPLATATRADEGSAKEEAVLKGLKAVFPNGSESEQIAAGGGDIGKHFPDNDPRYENIDSRILLREVIAALGRDGLRVGNADITIVAEEPRLAAHTAQMCANLAADLGIDGARVNVKATTTEKMGFVGRAEGIAAHAVVLLEE